MSFSTYTQAFDAWLRKEHVELSPKIEIADLRSAGLGRAVVALEPISSDEVLFKLPRNLLLSAENCSLIQDVPHAEEKLLDLSQWEALLIVILYEWLVKIDSKWKHYFDVLPITDTENYRLDQLMFWSDEEVELLKPSLIVNRIGKENAAAMYAKLVPSVVMDVTGVAQLQKVTFDQFTLAATLIMAYSFDVEVPKEGDGDDEEDDDEVADDSCVRDSGFYKCMVPLADTLNADTHKHNASLMYSSLHLVMKSIKPIAKGEQVYNTYSEHPNAEILRRYGYVEQRGSAHDFAEVPLSTIIDFFSENSSLSLETVEDIITVLKEAGEEDGEAYVLDAYDVFASSEVIFELTFLVQLLTLMACINDEKSFNAASLDVKGRGVRRVLKKCYQLLESGKITSGFISNYKSLLNSRLKDYPISASKGFPDEGTVSSRSSMASIVLVSEYNSIVNCLDTEKVFSEGESVFSVIDDGKVLRNIMKKDVFEGSDDQPKKKQRTT